MHGRQERCHYIDWLRVLALLVVFFFHVSRCFDLMEWRIKNPQTSVMISLYVIFVYQWVMPLFFLIWLGARGWLQVRPGQASQARSWA